MYRNNVRSSLFCRIAKRSIVFTGVIHHLLDHSLEQNCFTGIILPGALYVEMALEAALGTNFDQVLVKDLVFHSILPMSEELIRVIRCSKTDTECKGTHNFKVMCKAEKGDITLATAKLATFTKTASKESFTLSQACEYFIAAAIFLE